MNVILTNKDKVEIENYRYEILENGVNVKEGQISEKINKDTFFNTDNFFTNFGYNIIVKAPDVKFIKKINKLGIFCPYNPGLFIYCMPAFSVII